MFIPGSFHHALTLLEKSPIFSSYRYIYTVYIFFFTYKKISNIYIHYLFFSVIETMASTGTQLNTSTGESLGVSKPALPFR